MFKKQSSFWMVLLILSLSLGSCQTRISPPTQTPLSPAAALTAAIETANARLEATRQSQPTATPLPPTPSPTPLPTIISPTLMVATAAAPLTPTALTPQPSPNVATGLDNGAFTMKETVPDGTNFAAGESFTKSWQFVNTGQTTWTSGYALVFVGGDQMGGPASVALPLDVPPNQLVDIAVNLVAPDKAGVYKGFWRLRNPAGQVFGSTVWVQISVGNGGGTAVVTPGSGQITDISLSVDDTIFQGSCPHTFTFTGRFTLNSSASVTYQLEAGGFSGMNLPAAQTANYPAGTYELVYYLEITASGSGWARLHITAPNDIASSDITFSLVCQ